MHVAITILTIIASIKWVDWSTWRDYHTSMFFIATGGLLYEFIVGNYTLWKFHPDLVLGHEMTIILYALITMPLSILLFLSRFPHKWLQRLLYILLWSGIYIGVEWVLYAFGRISYENGWIFGYSFLFDLVMFTVIAIHHFHPLIAYILSIIITTLLIHYFNVPFSFS